MDQHREETHIREGTGFGGGQQTFEHKEKHNVKDPITGAQQKTEFNKECKGDTFGAGTGKVDYHMKEDDGMSGGRKVDYTKKQECGGGECKTELHERHQEGTHKDEGLLDKAARKVGLKKDNI